MSLVIREAALMRVVEAAEQAADWLEHPGDDDPIDQTAFLARRYLTALGYTGYRAVRELARTKSWASITFALSTEDVPRGIWLLKPVGTPIRTLDLVAAKQEAKNVGTSTWGVTNALRLQGARGQQSFDLDFAVWRARKSYSRNSFNSLRARQISWALEFTKGTKTPNERAMPGRSARRNASRDTSISPCLIQTDGFRGVLAPV
ncbi:MAG TPA: hypothetical protein VM166_11515 [Gemmatimonadaceae bacterium]|nr:hypothetical protein [Gemmatimonadaceae bacterium]